jgi:hypothetical protein
VPCRAPRHAQHNFYAQLHGRKLFFLLPPSELHHLHLFPALHGRYRSTQPAGPPSRFAAAHDAELQRLPLFRDLVERVRAGRGFQTALLSPGDVLYIPPMWFHGAVSLDPSISFSTCSRSRPGALSPSGTASPSALSDQNARCCCRGRGERASAAAHTV